MVGRNGHQQLVVIPAGERRLPGLGLAQRVHQTGGQGQRPGLEVGADARALEDMPQVGEQAVGDVDGRRGQPAQRLAGGQPRLGKQVALQQRVVKITLPALPKRQATGAAPQRPGHRDQVAGPGSAAGQGLAGGHFAHHGHTNGGGATGHVAAHQGRAGGIRQRPEAA